MQEDDQALGAPVQHPVVLGAHVAAQLPQFSVDLGAVREREVRHPVGDTMSGVEFDAGSPAELLVKVAAGGGVGR